MRAAFERYLAPRTLEEALRALAEGGATILAGGTDLMPRVRLGAGAFNPLLLNIKRIPELKNIEVSGVGRTRSAGGIRIGALTTVAEVLGDKLIKEHAPILAQAADCFASGQVRNMATLGGNICNASPAGDMIIPLLLLDAELELAGLNDRRLERRTLPLCGFFTGPGRTTLGPKELLIAIWFNIPAQDRVFAFKKFGARPALDISVVSVGVAGRRENGFLREARAAFGAVAPIPLRGRRTEAAINERALTPENIAAIAKTAREEVSPISDVRAGAWYRSELVEVLTGRLLSYVAGD